jgi:hypothetical protein
VHPAQLERLQTEQLEPTEGPAELELRPALKTLKVLSVLLPPHSGHFGRPRSDMLRTSLSKRMPHFRQSYSYTGMTVLPD